MARYLKKEEVEGIPRPFTTRLGKLKPEEMEHFLAAVDRAGRIEPAGGYKHGFTEEEARREGKRCLRCDCAGFAKCRLREYAVAYGARSGQYKGERRASEIIRNHSKVIFEPGKCISCGLCVLITEEASEDLGLTFAGRGFNVKVAVPFNRLLKEGLRKTAADCVAACPTGALVFNDAVN
jgi:ferredoxin